MIRHSRPERLFYELSQRSYNIRCVHDGIYNIGKVIGFDVQIIVSKELSQEMHPWLQSLQKNAKIVNFDQVYRNIINENDQVLKAKMLNYLDFLSKENPVVAKEWKEVNSMGEGLAMLMEPELNAAREQGIEQGKEQGIEQNQKSIIRNMLQKDYNYEIIMDIVGVSKAEIDDIQDELYAEELEAERRKSGNGPLPWERGMNL